MNRLCRTYPLSSLPLLRRPQDKSADWLAPAVGDQTLAVILFDFDRVDLQAVANGVGVLAPKTLADGGVRRVLEWRGKLAEANVRQAAVVLNLNDVPFAPPVVAVPTSAEHADSARAAILQQRNMGYVTIRQAQHVALGRARSATNANPLRRRASPPLARVVKRTPPSVGGAAQRQTRKGRANDAATRHRSATRKRRSATVSNGRW